MLYSRSLLSILYIIVLYVNHISQILTIYKFIFISPEYSLEGLMLKLKLQYFGYLMQRTDLFEKTLMLGKIEVGGEGDDRG